LGGREKNTRDHQPCKCGVKSAKIFSDLNLAGRTKLGDGFETQNTVRLNRQVLPNSSLKQPLCEPGGRLSTYPQEFTKEKRSKKEKLYYYNDNKELVFSIKNTLNIQEHRVHRGYVISKNPRAGAALHSVPSVISVVNQVHWELSGPLVPLC
jgi:hypothetical protein